MSISAYSEVPVCGDVQIKKHWAKSDRRWQAFFKNFWNLLSTGPPKDALINAGMLVVFSRRAGPGAMAPACRQLVKEWQRAE